MKPSCERSEAWHLTRATSCPTSSGSGGAPVARQGRALAAEAGVGPTLARGDRSVESWRSFFGIVIRMYYQDHEPAHFHSEHQGDRATFYLAGRLLPRTIRSRKARPFIAELAKLHRTYLAANWERMKAGQPLERIAPP